MALNIKNTEVERLAAQVAALTGETKTQAIRRAIEERKTRLAVRVVGRDRVAVWQRFLEREVWPQVSSGQRGRRLTREAEARLLGYGPRGV